MSSNRATSIVVNFHEKASNDGRPEEAAAEALGEQYVQHNPGAQDGAEGFIGYVHWIRGRFPGLHLDIKRTIAQDDLVVTHSNLHLEPGDRGMAVADIWRLEGDRIVEHWDVVQEVPEESSNDNTMF